eukprot:350255-Chlamydomonas_euryale.AAC.23
MTPQTAPASGAESQRGSGRNTISDTRTPSYSSTAAPAQPTPSSENCATSTSRCGCVEKYGMRPTRWLLAPSMPSACPLARKKPTPPAATLVATNTVDVESRSKPSRLDLSTNSTANSAPATGASNAADTPAAAPAAMSMRCRRRLSHFGIITAAVLAPSSTLGASGPREAPLPSVTALAAALRTTCVFHIRCT